MQPSENKWGIRLRIHLIPGLRPINFSNFFSPSAKFPPPQKIFRLRRNVKMLNYQRHFQLLLLENDPPKAGKFEKFQPNFRRECSLAIANRICSSKKFLAPTGASSVIVSCGNSVSTHKMHFRNSHQIPPPPPPYGVPLLQQGHLTYLFPVLWKSLAK